MDIPYSKNNDLVFKDALSARNSITKNQKREIRKLYNEWAREVRENAKFYSKIPGGIDESRQLAQLYYQLRSASKQLTTEINTTINNNVNYMGDVVHRVNKKWLSSLGISPESIDKVFSLEKDIAIRNIITGNIYKDGMQLSSKIWNITDSNYQDINNIIARGIAENQSLYDISKSLERYLNVDKKFNYRVQVWTNPTTGQRELTRVRNYQVDYNAQRLARTTIQHAYQQTMVAVTKSNPFVKGYVWHADGSHPCSLCLDRDGEIYTDSNMPLDHPNGQCSIEPVIDMDSLVNEVGSYREGNEVANEYLEWFRSLDFRQR